MNPLSDPRCFSPGHETPTKATPIQGKPRPHTGNIEWYRCACSEEGFTIDEMWTATECAQCHEKGLKKCEANSSSTKNSASTSISSQPESEPQERDGWTRDGDRFNFPKIIVYRTQEKLWWAYQTFSCIGHAVHAGGNWTTGAVEYFPSWPALKAALEAKGELKCKSPSTSLPQNSKTPTPPPTLGGQPESPSVDTFTNRPSDGPYSPKESNVGKRMKLSEMPVGTIWRDGNSRHTSHMMIFSGLALQLPNYKWKPDMEAEREVLADPVVEAGDNVQCQLSAAWSGRPVHPVVVESIGTGLIHFNGGMVWPLDSVRIVSKRAQFVTLSSPRI